MKNKRYNLIQVICSIYIVLTGGFNLYSYFHLPDTMATQISFSGEKVNHMPTPVYLLCAFLLTLILGMLSVKNEREQRMKYFLGTTIVFIANVVLLVMQL